MRILFYLTLPVVILLGTTFATLNLQIVTINYYVAKSTMPLALLLAITFAVGSLCGLAIGVWLLFKSKLKQRRINKRLSLAEKELENLRAIPLRETA